MKEELGSVIEQLTIAEYVKPKNEQTEHREIKLQKIILEELMIEKAKVKRRAELETKNNGFGRKYKKTEVKFKFPKLEIIKFKGNRLNWL